MATAVGQGLKHYGGHMPGSMKFGRASNNDAPNTTKSSNLASEPAPASLGDRVAEIHSATSPDTQRRTTIAGGEGTDASGNPVRVVGSSEPRLRPAQRAMLEPGKVEAKGKDMPKSL